MLTIVALRIVVFAFAPRQGTISRQTTSRSTKIAEHGFDIRYGARPLKRALAREILNPLSKAILDGEVRETDTVHVATRGEGLNQQKDGKAEFGWITSSDRRSKDRNDIIILKNHKAYSDDSVLENTLDEDVVHYHEA